MRLLLLLFSGSPADLLVVSVMVSAGNFCFHAAAAFYLCAMLINCKSLVVAVHIFFSLVFLWHVDYDAFAVLIHMSLLHKTRLQTLAVVFLCELVSACRH